MWRCTKCALNGVAFYATPSHAEAGRTRPVQCSIGTAPATPCGRRRAVHTADRLLNSEAGIGLPMCWCGVAHRTAHKTASLPPWPRCKSSQCHGALLRFAPCHAGKSIGFLKCLTACNTTPALRLVAIQLAQPVPGLRVRHAFGRHREPELVRPVDGRAHDLRGAKVGRHAEYERFVDLQLIHRQALQGGQRRMAGAEVVDRQLEAQRAGPVQRAERALRVAQVRAFHDFQAVGCRGHAVRHQQRVELLRQLDVEQVASRQVHRRRHRHPLGPQRQPVARSLFEHPHRQGTDEAGPLGERDEFPRRHLAALRVHPAHQRRGAARGTALHLGVSMGLEGSAQLAITPPPRHTSPS